MHNIQGYDLDDIDPVAQDIFQLIAEQEVPNKLALLALCRTIVLIGNDEDLDLACSMIDRIAEAVAEDKPRNFDEDENDD